MINLDAEILPGKAAAGFYIGQRLEEIMSSASDISRWVPGQGIPLYKAIRTITGWIKVSFLDLSGGRRSGDLMIFGNGIIELRFGSQGMLFQISVSAGYRGSLWGEFQVGQQLSLVQKHCDLVYDSGDEMHYPNENTTFTGVAFSAEEESLEESPHQIIHGISVHDWSLDV